MSLLLSMALLIVFSSCAPTVLEQSEITVTHGDENPTLDDFWQQKAHFELDVLDTGLPMGESDTVILEDGTWRSYLHASQQSLGVVDQCGTPVDFPGCVVTFTSRDDGKSFSPAMGPNNRLQCQIACARCPCESSRDNIDQQQYPRVFQTSQGFGANGQGNQWLLTYEYRASVILRRSQDGIDWSSPEVAPNSGIWRKNLMPCPSSAQIGEHPHVPATFDCLVGGPPGIFVDKYSHPPQLFLFVGLGQNPGAMGCYRGPLSGPISLMRQCEHNPLFVGASQYGPPAGPEANRYFDFRTISSAEVVRVGEHLYLFYEGVRGPRAGDQGDSQFLLGLARSATGEIDGEWELFPGNPILLELPGNVGVGHADVVVTNGITYLFTSLDGKVRSRLRLAWN